MSKHKTKPEDIRDPDKYFNSFVATEVQRSKEATKDYYKMFDSLDQIVEDELDGHRGQYTRALAGEDPCINLEDLKRCETPSEWMELRRSGGFQKSISPFCFYGIISSKRKRKSLIAWVFLSRLSEKRRKRR